MNTPHIPVLLDEVLAGFERIREGYFVDCTLGYAGHSEAMLQAYPHIKQVGIDRDEEALRFSRERLGRYAERTQYHRGTFSTVFPTLEVRPIVGILADFGVSSLQLDHRNRGFGFESDRLDMRMDSDAALSAYEVVNHYSQSQLEYIFHHYGEVRSYRRLAAEIVQARSLQPIQSAKALAEIVTRVIPKGGKIHPATLAFQAIRIEVNNELGEIEALLDAIEHRAKAGELAGTILSLITFHSLEDRLVKNRYKKWTQACICDPQAIRCTCSRDHDLGKMLRRKPITASPQEIRHNSRSRSAKLRTFIFKG